LPCRRKAFEDKVLNVLEDKATVEKNNKAQKGPGARRIQHTEKATAETATVAGVTITHPQRIIDPVSGATKLQVIEYYAAIARWLLPHLNKRPVSLVRASSGLQGDTFFQKHKGSQDIPQLTELDPALLPGHPPLLQVDTPATLIHCAQMNVVEFHTWNARSDDIEHPDRMLFDLDPGAGVSWLQFVAAARLMKGMLDELQLKSFLKTSGGKGLHIVVPLKPHRDWNTVKCFSLAIVEHMAGLLPKLFTAKSGAHNRVGRIFIDYLRNNRAATTAAAFSVRLRPGLGISMPLAWDELDDLSGSSHWHIGNVDATTTAQRAKTWQRYQQTRQTLELAMRKLNFTP
jgi:bifunctional non-homologous end joining protein LigD